MAELGAPNRRRGPPAGGARRAQQGVQSVSQEARTADDLQHISLRQHAATGQAAKHLQKCRFTQFSANELFLRFASVSILVTLLAYSKKYCSVNSFASTFINKQIFCILLSYLSALISYCFVTIICTGNLSDIYVKKIRKQSVRILICRRFTADTGKICYEKAEDVQSDRVKISYFSPFHKPQSWVYNNLHARNLLQYRLYFTTCLSRPSIVLQNLFIVRHIWDSQLPGRSLRHG